MGSPEQRPSDETAISMLSPPLSPYPRRDDIDFVALDKLRVTDSSTPQSAPSQTTASLTASSHTPRITTHAPAASALSASAAAKQRTADAARTDGARIGKDGKDKSRAVTNGWASLMSDPVSYFKRERGYLDLYPNNGPTWSNYVYVDPPTVVPAPRRARTRARRRAGGLLSADELSEGGGMVTRSSVRSSSAAPDMPLPLPTVRRAQSTRPSTPLSRTTGVSSPAPSVPSRIHDTALSQIEDYSPPTDTLPPGRSLRAEWKGAPMDLSQDPNVHLLHPAEVHLASVLRLPADVYLDSKKRLFAEKVHRLRQGLPFRRTDSQKACRIDVNKASRLFNAFEKVGWLDDSNFQKFL